MKLFDEPHILQSGELQVHHLCYIKNKIFDDHIQKVFPRRVLFHSHLSYSATKLLCKVKAHTQSQGSKDDTRQEFGNCKFIFHSEMPLVYLYAKYIQNSSKLLQ